MQWLFSQMSMVLVKAQCFQRDICLGELSWSNYQISMRDQFKSESEQDLHLNIFGETLVLKMIAVHYIGLTRIRYASDNPMNLAFPNIVLHPIKQDTLETSQFPHEI